VAHCRDTVLGGFRMAHADLGRARWRLGIMGGSDARLHTAERERERWAAVMSATKSATGQIGLSSWLMGPARWERKKVLGFLLKL
jgi:hypothetical protein